jgi:hypothetical protein
VSDPQKRQQLVAARQGFGVAGIDQRARECRFEPQSARELRAVAVRRADRARQRGTRGGTRRKPARQAVRALPPVRTSPVLPRAAVDARS